MSRKPYTKMTADELADATREFDAPGVRRTFRPLKARERKEWDRVKRGRGRPRKAPEEKAVRVLISLKPDLLAAAHRLAERRGMTLSGLIAKELKGATRVA